MSGLNPEPPRDCLTREEHARMEAMRGRPVTDPPISRHGITRPHPSGVGVISVQPEMKVDE